MVHMKSVLVTIVSAKTKYYEKLIMLDRATAGLCELSHQPKTSLTGHSLNVIFDSNFYRSNYCTNYKLN